MRGRFSFWLDFGKDDELIVAETIDELKVRRSFSSVIRDGIMIVNELRQGRVDLLLKLYPFVLDAIAERLPTPETPPPTDDLTRRLDELRELIEQGRVIPMFDNNSKMIMAGEKLPAPVALPVFADDDDDGDTLVLKRSTNTDGAANFLAAMSSLQQ